MSHKVRVNQGLCKGCGICVEFCPEDVFRMNEVAIPQYPERCVGCGLCEIRCPDYAVEVE